MPYVDHYKGFWHLFFKMKTGIKSIDSGLESPRHYVNILIEGVCLTGV